MKRDYVDIPEGQVHYQYDGSGEALLLLHQSTGSSEQYRKVAPFLAKSFRVLAMDLPGYGKSDAPPRRYEVADYARSVRDFLGALGVGRASVVGTRFGAATAAEVAAAYPEVVSRLVLNSLPTFDAETRAKLVKSSSFQPVEIKEDGSHLTRLWQFYQRIAPGAGEAIWHDSVVSALYAMPDVFAGEQAIFRYSEAERFPLIRKPCLIVSGSVDVFYPRLDYVSGLIPGSRTRVIEGGDARLTQRMPAEFAAAVLDFLK